MRVKKLKDLNEIIKFTRLFNKVLGYSHVPWKYFASGDCYALIDGKNRIAGGFVLVPGYFNLRSIAQMPEDVGREYFIAYPKVAQSLCDLTGYFILNPKKGFLLTVYLTLVCLFHNKKYFIYTYPVKETGLGNYYGQGKPLRIHTGVPEHLEGHGETMHPEHVEILTKWGIVKIFLYRNIRLFMSKFKRF